MNLLIVKLISIIRYFTKIKKKLGNEAYVFNSRFYLV